VKVWILIVLGACFAGTAHADSTYGVGVEVTSLDLHAQRAAEFGMVAKATGGRGRVQGLGELAFGVLSSDGPIGSAADARIGGRFRAVTFEDAVDLSFDAGFGLERDAVSNGPAFLREYGFVGWVTGIRGRTRTLELALRILAAPTLDNPDALRGICRGECAPAADLPPLDLGVAVQGNLVW
jgi:hypothetical protein